MSSAKIPIEEHEGYFITEDGSVYSDWNRGSHKRDPGKYRRLNPGIASHGYLTVTLRKSKGIAVTRSVHRLVAEAFLDPPKREGLDCCHRDGHKHNNASSNLMWATRAENNSHKILHGTSIRGEQCPWAKLSEQDVREIRKSDLPNTTLSDQYDVDHTTIRNVRIRKNWKHID